MQHWFEHIIYHGRTQPETPAIVTGERVVTYGMLRHAIERCAEQLLAHDIPRSGPVGVLVQNPVRHLALVFALYRLGIASLSLEPGQAADAPVPFAAIVTDAGGHTEAPTNTRLITAANDWFALDQPVKGELPQGFTDGQAICRLSLTSGTTGVAKAVRHSVDTVARRVAWKFQLDVPPTGRAMLCMPGLSSFFGFGTSCTVLVAGRTLCFATSQFEAVRMIELFGIDFATVSAEQLLALTRAAKRTGAKLTSLRLVLTGGNFPSTALLQQATAYLCREIRCAYGASEVDRIAQASARDVAAEPGLVGYVLPGIDVAVVDAAGNRSAAGQIGEIRVRGSSADAPAPHDWITPGDVGFFDAAGRLHVVGRSVDKHAAGAAPSPALELEHMLRLEWDVDDCAALVMDNASDGRTRIVVAVVKRGDADPAKLEALMRARGRDYSIRFFDVDSVPRGINGKINRRMLEAMLVPAGGAAVSS